MSDEDRTDEDMLDDDYVDEEMGNEFREIVRRQIENNDPPITSQTFTRLMDEVGDEDEVIRMLACALTVEVYTMIKKTEVFDVQRFTAILNRLPDESYLDEDA